MSVEVAVEEVEVKASKQRKHTDEELHEIRRQQGKLLAERRRNGEFDNPLSTWKEISALARKYGIRQRDNKGVRKTKGLLRRQLVAMMDVDGQDTENIKNAWNF